MPGLLGIALSGAGPSVLAVARSNFNGIGEELVGRFSRHGIRATVRVLEVDDAGRRVEMLDC